MKRSERLLWGVLLKGSMDEKPSGPLYAGWAKHPMNKHYVGEPAHALLFEARSQARYWCREQHDKYRGRNDCCAKWRFRPVRIRETLTVIR